MYPPRASALPVALTRSVVPESPMAPVSTTLPEALPLLVAATVTTPCARGDEAVAPPAGAQPTSTLATTPRPSRVAPSMGRLDRMGHLPSGVGCQPSFASGDDRSALAAAEAVPAGPSRPAGPAVRAESRGGCGTVP